MRQIKFRIYDKGIDAVIHDPAHFYLSADGEIYDMDHDLIADAPLMQYTGIKDNNGYEIYEGDILEIIYDSMIQERSVHEVKYCDDEGYPAFELQPTEDVEMNNFAWLTSDTDEAVISYRVIGNRYENPELLEEVTR